MMFVVYESDDEVLVTTKDNETRMLREWFVEGDRDPEDYDRSFTRDTDSAVRICNRLRVG